MNRTISNETSSNQIGGVVLASVLLENESNLVKNATESDVGGTTAVLPNEKSLDQASENATDFAVQPVNLNNRITRKRTIGNKTGNHSFVKTAPLAVIKKNRQNSKKNGGNDFASVNSTKKAVSKSGDSRASKTNSSM